MVGNLVWGLPNTYLYDVNAHMISVGILRYKCVSGSVSEATWVNA